LTSSSTVEMWPGIQRMAFQSVRHASAFVSANIITDIWKNMFFVPLFVLLYFFIWLLNGGHFTR